VCSSDLGQPVIVHAGPFANIAIGQSSVIADKIGLKLADYHVTESGFGADIGFEKFWNLKCRFSGLIPDCAVVVATIRALKCHGGAPVPVPGKAMPKEYLEENVDWVAKGCGNLIHHIRNVRKAGISPVVCINAFYTDTPAEINKVRELCEKEGAKVALSRHWEQGGAGAIEFAQTVIAACEEKPKFKFLYDLDMPIKQRIELIAKEVYGADGVDYSVEANKAIERIQKDPVLSGLGMCMVKTHLSLSDNPALKGVPKGWRLTIREVLTYGGAGFIVPVAGSISLMPGTSSNPAFKRVDINLETGKVEGVF
jgi:formate--tetrahydrofolate ligase